MKKRILSVLLVASIVLTGCTSSGTAKKTRATDDDDVRLTTEETTKRNRETGDETESVSDMTEATTETTAFVDPRTRESVADGTVSISLEGMTAEEIIATFDQMTKVYDGDTMEEYLKRFTRPASSSTLDGAYFLHDDLIHDDTADYIVSFSVNGANIRSSDGTITIREKTSIIITFYISDYEFAKELYDKLLDYYCTKDIVEDVRREEKRWYAGDMHFKIQMSHEEGKRAGITVTIPLNPPKA